MSRNRFVIWGMGFFLLFLLSMATLTFLLISKIIPIDALNPAVPLFLYLILPIGFSIILWKRFSAIGRSKLTLIPCFIFIVLATVRGGWLTSLYLDASDFVGNAMMPIVYAAIDGNDVTVWMRAKYTLYLLLGTFIVNWGFFALLSVGSMDPKAPNSIWQKAKHLINRTPKQTPLQADPILVNGTW